MNYMMHRRRFFEWLLSIGGAGTTAMVAYPLLNFVAAPPRSSEAAEWIDAGSAAELREGTAKTIMTSAGLPVTVINRGAAGLVALEKKCPHLGCMVDLTEDMLICPCHGAKFTLDGTLISGPSPRGLKRFAIEQRQDGHVFVGKETAAG